MTQDLGPLGLGVFPPLPLIEGLLIPTSDLPAVPAMVGSSSAAALREWPQAAASHDVKSPRPGSRLVFRHQALQPAAQPTLQVLACL